MKHLYLLTQALHRWNQIELRLIWAYEGLVVLPKRDWHVAPRPLSSLRVLEGWIEIKTAGQQLKAKPGDVLVIPPGNYPHRTVSPTRVRSIACETLSDDAGVALAFCEPFIVSPGNAKAVDRAAEGLLTKLYGSPSASSYQASLTFVPKSLQHHAQIQSALWNWFAIICGLLAPQSAFPAGHDTLDPRVVGLARLIASQDLDQPFSPNHYEREMSLSWRRLEQLFKAATQMTPRQYYDQRRALVAYRSVAGTSAPAKQIAYALGFRQASHFSRWFSKLFGKSPSQLRAGLQ